MPARDGAGPRGYDVKAGWGAGFCATPLAADALNRAPGPGFGSALGRGWGGGMCMRRRAARDDVFGQTTLQTERSHLENQMETLQNQLSIVKLRLEALETAEPQKNERSS